MDQTASLDLPEEPEQRIELPELLRLKALAYGFVALLFGALWLATMIVPDPLLFVDEVVLLLGAAFTGRKAVRAAK